MRNHGDNQASSLLGRREAVGRDYAASPYLLAEAA
jgi:hypothetical protein